jgi:hypothetical protein
VPQSISQCFYLTAEIFCAKDEAGIEAVPFNLLGFNHTMNALQEGDLGFTFAVSKNGNLEIMHHGKLAGRFSKAKGIKLGIQLNECSFSEQQQLMARLTGNYKRGNERLSQNHGRNRQ